MLKRLLCYSQYILPQHFLSILMGQVANCKTVWFKNKLIDWFCHHYRVDLTEAVASHPHDYETFNQFFTRELKPGARPISSEPNTIASPADGKIAASGAIHQGQLLQAKSMYFSVNSLLGNQTTLAAEFESGQFATIYLAPHNYHRVHMPLAGKLRQSIYIPGKLFSVNQMTSQLIPNLYARNERLALIFDTEHGPMAMVLVGALIVGSIQTVWMNTPKRSHQLEIETPADPVFLEKGAELGRFLLGSTVVMLLPNLPLTWITPVSDQQEIRTGELIANLSC